MAAVQDLYAFEHELDDAIAQLPLLSMPVRTVLTVLYGVVDSLFNGSRLDSNIKPRVEAGYALAGRLSYLVPHILRCPLEPAGENAADALSIIDPATLGPQLELLISYGHFCEVIPQVRRGYYEVSIDLKNPRRYILKHPSVEFADDEARDIVLSELGMAFFVHHRIVEDTHFDKQAKSFPVFDLGLLATTVKRFYEHYLEHGYEKPIMTDEGYHAALGTTRETFVRFRAAWAALADYCLGMAAAVVRLARGKHGAEREAVMDEFHEWVAVTLKSTFVLGTICAIARIVPAEIDGMCQFFFINAQAGGAPHAGDGYYPPVLRFKDSLLFNPDVVRSMLASRNIPYVMNKTQRARFDNLVSKFMEPQLINDAATIIGRVDGMMLVRNHEWANGEIDLLAYRESENIALHIQAKAPIPADSARMVQAVETRVREGLEQLSRLRSLEQPEIDAIVSRATRKSVRHVRIVDVLLCRAGIGTHATWKQLGNVVPVNLTVLNAVVKRMETGAPVVRDAFLARFANEARDFLDDMCRSAVKRWDHEDLVLGHHTVSVPLLRLDRAKLDAARHAFYPP